MMDKVQKIREEVARIQLYTQSEVLKDILDYIDKVQEEPVSGDFEMALAEMIDKAQKCVVEPWVVAAQWKDELIKLAKSEEPVSEKKCMFTKDSYNDEDRKTICEDCKEKCEYSKAEEPVSEDLEEASKEWLRPQLDKSYADYGETKMMELTHFDGYAMLDAIEFGAKWQEKKDQSTIELAEDHAMLAGMEKMEQQMMTKATEVTVHIDAGGYPYIPEIELYDYDKDIPLAKEGDRYKVVLIKEE